jgi:dTDP-4-amino-4,6-dideoxygalactose transaminase
MFWIILSDQHARDTLLEYLKAQGILAVFHYVPLHSSPMGKTFGYQPSDLPVTEDVSGRLLRLPLYHELTDEQLQRVIDHVVSFLAR